MTQGFLDEPELPTVVKRAENWPICANFCLFSPIGRQKAMRLLQFSVGCASVCLCVCLSVCPHSAALFNVLQI